MGNIVSALDDDLYKVACQCAIAHQYPDVVGSRQGKCDKFIFRFDPDGTYDLRVLPDIDLNTLNFVTVDSGVVVHLIEDGKLEIFNKRKGSSSYRMIEDDILEGDMILYSWRGKVFFSKAGKLYSMEVK